MLLFLLLPAQGQAQIVTDRGVSAFVAAGIGPQFEGRGGSPITEVGMRRTVEGGLRFGGGSLFVYELGLRASNTSARDSSDHDFVARSFGVFGGVVIRLVPPSLLGPLVPVVRGGIGIGRESDRRSRRQAFNAGPHLGLGLAWPLDEGAALMLSVMTNAQIAPFTMDVALHLALVAARF